MSERGAQPDDYGAVYAESNEPQRQREHARLLLQIDKTFQIKVLLIFVATVLALVALDIVYIHIVERSIFLPTMQIITPIFTFILGIGTNVKS
jgi:hypothetical protein